MKIRLLYLLLAFPLFLAGQSAKKYIYVEHFTNTLCPICTNHNPGLFTRLDNNPGEVHHFSVHSEVPYPSCVFYQANTTGNNTRKNLYGITGTPTSYTQGVTRGVGTNLLPQSRIDNLKGQTSPIRIAVRETKSGGMLNVTAVVETYSTLSTSGLKLYAAVVERRINYNAPNGEGLHYNVFRTMLPSNNGEPFTAAPMGSAQVYNYSVALDPAWDTSQIYAVVFIQDPTTKEVVNSGTKFDILMDPVIEGEECVGAENGSIDLNVTGGTPPFTYIWSNGATTEMVSNLTSGSYTVTVRDVANFEFVDMIDISISSTLQANLSYTPTSTNNGTATATVSGGTPPYMYMWSTGSTMATIMGLSAGVVSVTVTDDNGCELVDSVEVKSLAIIPTITDVSCYGDANGSIEVTISGGEAPFTYSWSTGATTNIISNLAAGNYSLTVTDNNSDVVEGTFMINEPDELTLSTSVTDDVGNSNSGSIDLTITGGVAPFSFSWSNGATTNQLSNIGAGVYDVEVTDANGCSIVTSVTVLNGPTSVNDLESKLNIEVYPNPFGDALILDLSDLMSDRIDVVLLDLTGRIVFSERVNSLADNYSIRTSNISQGVYFLRVADGENAFTKKIVKQ